MVDSKMTGGKPDPDPTLLTTQNLLHEIELLKELFNEKFTHLQDLNNEKFAGINTRFAEARYLTEQTSRNDKLALDAALQAQKEDVGKQNDSNNASISKTEVLFTKQIDGLNDKIDDIKSRFIAGDSQIRGKTEGVGSVGAIIVGSALVISAAINVMLFINSHPAALH
jgi:hypothetical protein